MTLREMCTAIEDLHGRAKSIGLTNRSIVGASLNSVRLRSDEILDIVESIETSMNPAAEAIIDRSVEEYRRGESYDLASVR